MPVAATATPRAGLLTLRSGDDLQVSIFGLTPNERAGVNVRVSTREVTIPGTADPSGDVRLLVPLRGEVPLEVLVRRAPGADLRTVFALSPATTPPGGRRADRTGQHRRRRGAKLGTDRGAERVARSSRVLRGRARAR